MADGTDLISAAEAQFLIECTKHYSAVEMAAEVNDLARTVIALHAALDAERAASGVAMERLGEVVRERDEARRERETLSSELDRLHALLDQHGHVECDGCGATLPPPFADGDLCTGCSHTNEAADAARKEGA